MHPPPSSFLPPHPLLRVLVEGRGDVLLQGLEAMNRAVDGDTMAVEVLEEARAPAKVTIILLLPLLLLLLLLLLLPLLLHLLLHLLQVVLQDEGFNLGDTLEAANTLLSKAVKSKEEQVVTYSSSSSSSGEDLPSCSSPPPGGGQGGGDRAEEVAPVLRHAAAHPRAGLQQARLRGRREENT